MDFRGLRTLPCALLLAASVAAADPGPAPLAAASAPHPRWDASLGALVYGRGDSAGEAGSWGEWGYHVPGIAATGGWYWSHHQRSEVSVASTGAAQVEANYDSGYPNAPAWVSEEKRHTLVSLAHVVQFGRNAWIHPQLGAGACLDLEHRHGWLQPVDPAYADGVSWPSRADRERVLAAHPDGTTTTVRAFALGAVKAYLGQRTFLRVSGTVMTGDPARWTGQVALGRDFGGAR